MFTLELGSKLSLGDKATTLPENLQLASENGGWETILSSWEAFFLGFFLRGYVSFREGILCRWDLMIHQNQIAMMLGHFLRNKFPLHSPPHFFNVREAVVSTGRKMFLPSCSW